MSRIISFKHGGNLEEITTTLAKMVGGEIAIYSVDFYKLKAINTSYAENKNIPRGDLFEVKLLEVKNRYTKKESWEYEIIPLNFHPKTSQINRMKSIVNSK